MKRLGMRWGSAVLAGGIVAALGVVVACAATPEVIGLDGDVEWQLVELAGEPIATREGTPTLRYDAAERRVGGSAGCNRYFGSVTEGPDGGVLELGPLGATRKLCPPPAMELESRFLAVLRGVTRWERSGPELVLSGPEGSLRFAAPGPAD